MKKIFFGLLILASSVSFAKNSVNPKKVISFSTKVEVVSVTCSDYTADGDRITLNCKTCNTKKECEAKLKKILEA